MTRLLVINHQQHGPGGRRGRVKPGAVHDIDGDGEIQAHETEFRLTPHMILGVREELGKAGHLTTRVDGVDEARKAGEWPVGYPYGAQQEKANQYAEDNNDTWVVYLAWHLNSSSRGGNYGSFLHVTGSYQGMCLAAQMAVGMAGREGVPRAHNKEVYDDRHHRGMKGGKEVWLTRDGGEAWLYNAHNTIKGTLDGPGNVFGVCCEPRFIQSLDGMLQLDVAALLRDDGRAMGRMILKWFESVQA